MARVLVASPSIGAVPHAGSDGTSVALIPLLVIAIIAGCFLYAWPNGGQRRS